MSIYEVLMIVCFGFAWPINLINSIKSKSTKGKNLIFLLIILVAYVFGIIHKMVYSRDAAIYFYILNAGMVFGDVLLYFINRNREIKSGKARSFGKVLL